MTGDDQATASQPTDPPGAARMTLAEAARRSGHAAVSLRQAVRLGRLRAERVGEGNRATLYVKEADLAAYLAGRKSWRTYGSEPQRDRDRSTH